MFGTIDKPLFDLNDIMSLPGFDETKFAMSRLNICGEPLITEMVQVNEKERWNCISEIEFYGLVSSIGHYRAVEARRRFIVILDTVKKIPIGVEINDKYLTMKEENALLKARIQILESRLDSDQHARFNLSAMSGK
jgi:hypothetical protein